MHSANPYEIPLYLMFLSGVNKENIYIANTCLAIACPEASGSIQCQMIGEGKKESEMKMELFYRDVIILDSKTVKQPDISK